MCANLAPVLESAKANGTSLVLTYAEDLDTSSVPLPGAYSVRVDGGAGPAVSSVSVSGTTVTLTLATAVTAGPAVTVTYTPGSNPVQDESGLDALPLTGQEVVIVDTTPPIPASAEVPASGDTLNLTFNENLDIGPGKLPPADAFTVKADGVAVTVQDVVLGTDLDNFVLNLPDDAINQCQTVTVDYAVPGTNPIQDTDDNDAMGFTDFAVDNNSTVECLNLNPPVFDEDMLELELAENAPAGTAIGEPVTATDEDGDTPTYSLGDVPFPASAEVPASGSCGTGADALQHRRGDGAAAEQNCLGFRSRIHRAAELAGHPGGRRRWQGAHGADHGGGERRGRGRAAGCTGGGDGDGLRNHEPAGDVDGASERGAP